ncbi:MAG: cytochrome b/b6 domain-containing protein [Flavobacteriaceae bacterium]|nr:cytochrome b/b6 domain-containing protein [Flavobacteriaceae bacterium]
MKTYIWSIPTRIFHWLLAIGFTIAYILSDFENFRNLHFAFGGFVGILIIFRLLFGLFGPKYSNFSDFPLGLKNQKEFIKTYFSKSPKLYPGHNPLASVIILCILFIGIICSISGYMLYATENNVLNIGINEEFLEESHEITANLFLVLVGIHLFGMMADKFFHSKTGTLNSIFTGYKNIESKNTQLNSFHKIFSLLWFTIPFIIFYLAYGLQINTKENENENSNKEYYEHNDD